MSESFKITLGTPTNGNEKFRWEFKPSSHDGGFTAYRGEVRIATLADAMGFQPPSIVKLVSCHDLNGKQRDDLVGAVIVRYGTHVVAEEWYRKFDTTGPALVRSILHESTRGAREVMGW